MNTTTHIEAIAAGRKPCQCMLSISRLIAIPAETSFALPKSLALMMYPSAAAILRRPEIANSRAITTIVIHAGTTRTSTSAISADDTNSLSAIGSRSVPTVVI